MGRAVRHWVAMPTFRRCMDWLVARLEPNERILARGRAYEPLRWGGLDLTAVVSPGCPVVVTERRTLWVDGGDERWMRSLPFALVRFYTEIIQGHRYALALAHEGIECLQWEPAHRFLGWSWGNAAAIRRVTASVLAFSHRDTDAAQAIRDQLHARGVPAGEPRSLPKAERPDYPVAYRVLRA